jgi:hypothetical protein
METYDGPAWRLISTSRGGLKGAARRFDKTTMQAGQGSDEGGGWLRGNVYAAGSGCVVILVLGDLVPWRHSVRASRGPLSVLLSS